MNHKKARSFACTVPCLGTLHVKERAAMQRAEIRILTDEQERRIIGAAHNTEIEAAVLLALRFGLRRSEIIDMRWTDIDF